MRHAQELSETRRKTNLAQALEPATTLDGTRIEILAKFNNSANKRGNPDPNKVVRWGSASEMEMMDGWIEYLDADNTTQSASNNANSPLASN